jgi:mRNA-degrading endonuclease RelE of RelBE toxin-antitoxin system
MVAFPACHASALELFDFILESRIIKNMKTVIETPTFQKQAEPIWTEDERLTFISWISQNPLAGDVIPGAEGARKVRWSVAGKGKRGGVRVIYFNMVEKDVIVLITLYQKSNRVNIKASVIKKAV